LEVENMDETYRKFIDGLADDLREIANKYELEENVVLVMSLIVLRAILEDIRRYQRSI